MNIFKKEVDNPKTYQLLLRSFIKWIVIDENANLMKFHLAFSNEPEVTHELSNGTLYGIRTRECCLERAMS